MNDDTPKDLFAVPRLVTSPDDCLFYHTMDVPSYGTVEGYWDIRGNESQYLGGVEFRDKRVLEIGPASGQLSFFMEREGAGVISLEAAEDYAWEFYWNLQDTAPEDLRVKLEAHREMMEKLKNSYWFCHRVLSSNAKVHYGSAYSVPRQLGKFHISVLACILLHNKNPLRIIENCARVTGDTMIIVEAFRERPFTLPFMEFLPSDHKHGWHTWWGFAPSFLINVLRSMGFPHTKITFHTQKCFGKPADLFTIVASRSPLKEISPDDGPAIVQLSCPVERLRIDAGRLISLPLSVLNLSEAPLSSFSASPTLMSYHWRQKSGEVAVWDGLRTPFPRIMYKGDKENIILTVITPATPGIYLLEITMLKEHVTWYDNKISGLPLQIETVITP
ncbi:MAG: hypothetical protein WKF74_07325 [Pyrinomonadaceae bacterium]